MKKLILAGVFALMIAPTGAMAYGQAERAAIGGGLGGALGGYLGYELGGREGGMLGGALGGATGVAIATEREPRQYRGDRHYREPRRTEHHHYHAPRQKRGGGFCPPGLAKQGRCR